MKQIEYTDDNGQTLTAYPVVIIADRTLVSQAYGSKTRFVDNDNRIIDATPLIVMEDYRDGEHSGGSGVISYQFTDSRTTFARGRRVATGRLQSDFAVASFRATLERASTSGPVTIDINVNGASIFGDDKLTIDVGELSSFTAAVSPDLLRAALYDDSEVTIDVDVAGAGAAGLRVYLTGSPVSLGGRPNPPTSGLASQIAGTASVGSTLTFIPGEVSGADATDLVWVKNSTEVLDWGKLTYVVKPADAAATIEVLEYAANGAYGIVRTVSAGGVALPKPQVVTNPSLSGSFIELRPIAAVVGAWLYGPTSYTYFWQFRSSPSSAWVTIGGATSTTFTPISLFVGGQVRVGVYGINGSGASEQPAYSAPQTIVQSRTSEAWPPPVKPIGEYRNPMDPVAATGSGRTFHVGPGRQHEDLTTVPWLSLIAGDAVNIYWRSEPYRTKIGLRCMGTAANPVIIKGVSSVLGLRPVIDGDGANTAIDARSPNGTTEPYYSSLYWENSGVIQIYSGLNNAKTNKAKHIIFDNLKITGARYGHSYINQFGESTPYGEFSCGIYAITVEDLTIEQCEITGNGNGVFTNVKNDDETDTSYNVILRRNLIYDNGLEGSYLIHNLYIQCVRDLYEGNHIGRLRPGCNGASLKSRSSGTVIRYNVIEPGSRLIDLVDTDGGSQTVGKDPLYPYAWVYGNLLVDDFLADTSRTASGTFMHWGGDLGGTRNGTLFFYNNTCIMRGESSSSYYARYFQQDNVQCKLAMSSNIFVKYGSMFHYFTTNNSVVDMYGINWITTGYTQADPGSPIALTQHGTLLTGSDPILSSVYRIMAGSPCMNGGLADLDEFPAFPSPAAIENLRVTHQPGLVKGTYVLRTQLGTNSDLGCFETEIGDVGPPSVTTPPWVTGIAQEGQTLTGHLGDWTFDPDLSPAWLADGDLIPGADEITHLNTSADVGRMVSLQVLAQNDGGVNVATTVGMLIVSADTPAVISATELTGTPVVGQFLYAPTVEWTNSPSEVLAWLRNGVVIPGATGTAYQLVDADADMNVGPRFTATSGSKSNTYTPAPLAITIPTTDPDTSGKYNFVGPAGTTLVALDDAWTSTGADNSRLVCSGDGGLSCLAGYGGAGLGAWNVDTPSTADQSVEAQMRAGWTGSWGLGVHVNGGQSGYVFYVDSVKVVFRRLGVYIDQPAHGVNVATTSITIKATLIGGLLTVYANGVSIFTYTDSSPVIGGNAYLAMSPGTGQEATMVMEYFTATP